jgi:hypothetical protein
MQGGNEKTVENSHLINEYFIKKSDQTLAFKKNSALLISK